MQAVIVAAPRRSEPLALQQQVWHVCPAQQRGDGQSGGPGPDDQGVGDTAASMIPQVYARPRTDRHVILVRMTLTFEEKLNNYARLAVRVGLGVREGQRVLVQAPVDTAQLARAVVREAYAAGASFVDVRWDDDDVQLARFELAPDGSFDTISRWRVDAEIETAQAGGAVIAIRATNPNLLGGVDAGRVATHQRALAAYRRPYTEQVMTNRLNWNLISAPIPGWAALMFPDASADEAVSQQWDAIFAATRADQPDPVAAWQEHLANLQRRRELLTEKQYAALHFQGGETDLTVGLAEDHVWGGGAAEPPASSPSPPTFPPRKSGPRRTGKRGRRGGQHQAAVVQRHAARRHPHRVQRRAHHPRHRPQRPGRAGQDDRHRRGQPPSGRGRAGAAQQPDFPLGNVLLQHPVRRERRLAHRHRQRIPLQRERRRGPDYRAVLVRGGNDSLTHVDWMIGSGEMNVDGIAKDGTREPVMRAGEFVI